MRVNILANVSDFASLPHVRTRKHFLDEFCLQNANVVICNYKMTRKLVIIQYFLNRGIQFGTKAIIHFLTT